MKKKAAIFIISGRKELLYNTLNSFFKNWNSQFNYPVYVHTFGKVYSKLEKQIIKKNISTKHFKINSKKNLGIFPNKYPND